MTKSELIRLNNGQKFLIPLLQGKLIYLVY